MNRAPFKEEEIVRILRSEDKNTEEKLFEEARKVRNAIFSNRIFMYGFVYFTTWCRNSCTFCYYRKENSIDRYRKPLEEVVKLSGQLADSGVNLIDLTMGEDQFFIDEDFETLEKIIREIKDRTGLPVMISPGVIKEETAEKLARAGADWYALYQETHNRKLFKELRLGQDYDERMNAKLHAKKCGMLVEEGIMTGIGETYEDIAHSIIEMGNVGASQVRVMSFVPQQGSPMENISSPDRNLELRIIALMRIIYPHALIPASLDVDGIAGLKARINAGANVVTSIIPPRTGLAGVAQSSMDVDDGGRTVEEVSHILKHMGLEPADSRQYMEYLEKLK